MIEYRCGLCRDVCECEHHFKQSKCTCGNLTVSGSTYLGKNKLSALMIYDDYYHEDNTTIDDLRKMFPEQEQFLSELFKWVNRSIWEKEEE